MRKYLYVVWIRNWHLHFDCRQNRHFSESFEKRTVKRERKRPLIFWRNHQTNKSKVYFIISFIVFFSVFFWFSRPFFHHYHYLYITLDRCLSADLIVWQKIKSPLFIFVMFHQFEIRLKIQVRTTPTKNVTTLMFSPLKSASFHPSPSLFLLLFHTEACLSFRFFPYLVDHKNLMLILYIYIII